MSKQQEFEAVIEDSGRGGSLVRIPFDVEKVFGKKRVPVKATFDGVLYRGSLVRMGTDSHILGVRKDIRKKIGKDVGDSVRVTVEEDTGERVVEVPDDLQHAIATEPGVKTFFDSLSYTHRKEYINWITEAKKEETRARRIAKAIAMMKSGQKGR